MSWVGGQQLHSWKKRIAVRRKTKLLSSKDKLLTLKCFLGLIQNNLLSPWKPSRCFCLVVTDRSVIWPCQLSCSAPYTCVLCISQALWFSWGWYDVYLYWIQNRSAGLSKICLIIHCSLFWPEHSFVVRKYNIVENTEFWNNKDQAFPSYIHSLKIFIKRLFYVNNWQML